jgi:hypothetical protein
MGETKSTGYMALVGKFEGKGPLERRRYRWEYNIEGVHRNITWARTAFI